MSRNVIVTGAGRGIGRGIAEELAAAGWSVGINFCGNAAAAEESRAACAAKAIHKDQRFVTIQADISVAADRERLADQAWTAFGSVDALVNNAGIAPKVRNDILSASLDSFREIITTNLEGPYFLTQLVARRMLAHAPAATAPAGVAPSATGSAAPGACAPQRHIVFITSISAETASVMRGDYCLSKAALAMASKLWAARLAAENIGVYEVRPGIMATDMTAGVKEKYDALIASGLVPQNRWGTPADVGRAVRSLLAGDWSYSSGAVIHVDGGFSVSRL